jgi:hypothetical protein
MNRPPLINQITLNDPQASMDCGETAVSMILQAFGIMDTPYEEIADLSHDGATNADELVGLLAANALAVILTPAVAEGSSIANGVSCLLILIQSNNNADPGPPFDHLHWIVGYQRNPDGSVQCANPSGGRDVAYGAALLAGATVVAYNVSDPRVPVIHPFPPPSAASGGSQGYPDDQGDSMIAPMWDATTAPWQPRQNIAWVGVAGNLVQRWGPETGGVEGEAVIVGGLVPISPVDLFVDVKRHTVHLRARTVDGHVMHAWQTDNAPWGHEIIT